MNLHLLNECVLTYALLEEKGCPRDSVAVFPLSDICISSIKHQPAPETPMCIPNTESLDLKFRLILSAYNLPGEEGTVCFLSKVKALQNRSGKRIYNKLDLPIPIYKRQHLCP